ncbi:MAG: Na/Pi cotransporter family protein [Myxococcota bacterium]
MDGNLVASIAAQAIGGLGIFLLGMKFMSEGLQAVAGDRLRRMISRGTSNRVVAVGTGSVVTSFVQSSSVTTVIVVGLVNAGFMTLHQAIGVIMGANIGTTITGWILVLKIGKWGLPILGVAAMGYLFMRRDRTRYLSMAVMGMGMIFFGLELMKDGFAPIRDMPEFLEWFHRFSADTYLGVLKVALVGCVLTFVVQSSSATLGITIGLAIAGVIPFTTAAALVLGENIGTTITAMLASIGVTTNARRAAMAHLVFNILGVVWVTALFAQYMEIMQHVVQSTHGMDIMALDYAQVEAGDGAISSATFTQVMTFGIAAVHTGFNVTNVLLFLPFTGLLASGMRRVFPDRATKEKPHLTSLDYHLIDSPVLAIEESRVELLRMASSVDKMMAWLARLTLDGEHDERLERKTFHREEVLDDIQQEILAFLGSVLGGNAPHSVTEEARDQLRIAEEYESLSDAIITILKAHLKLRRQDLEFSEEQLRQIAALHEKVAEYVHLVRQGLIERDRDTVRRLGSRGPAIKHLAKGLRDEHLAALAETRIDPQISMAYTNVLASYRRVRNHAQNVAEALSGGK